MHLRKASHRNTQLHVAAIGNLSVWYSYETPVAYRVDGAPIVVRQNEWGPTTGRHIREIEAAEHATGERIDGATFERQLAALVP